MLDKNNKLEECVKNINTLTKQTLRSLFDKEEMETNIAELYDNFTKNNIFFKSKSLHFPDKIKRDELYFE